MTDHADIISLLENVPMFSGISPEYLEQVAGALQWRVEPGGAVLFRQDEPPDCMYVIAQGKVVMDTGGSLLTVLGRGQHFGEVSLLEDRPRTATARALEDCRLLTLPKQPFDQLLAAHPDVARQMLGALSAYVRRLVLSSQVLPESPLHGAGASLSGKLIAAGDEHLWTIGSAESLRLVDAALAAFASWLHVLPGKSRGPVLIARVLVGSVARLADFKTAGDLDIETLLVYTSDEPERGQLGDAGSAALAELARFLLEHVEAVLRDHPEVRFIELKAGTCLQPETGEPCGIKWWLDDLRRGRKEVFTANGKQWTTLTEALAMDARIKMDWAIPSVQASALCDAYQETTVIYHMGYRVGHNQIRLRPSADPGTLPLRHTSIALDPDEAALLSEACRQAAGVPLEQVHWRLIEAIHKYVDHDKHKALKRLYGLLQFWESVPDYAVLTQDPIQHDDLLERTRKVIFLPELRWLSQVRAQAELFRTVEEHGIVLPGRWLDAACARFETRNRSVAAVLERIDARITARVEECLREEPVVQRYLSYVLERTVYLGAPLTESPLFLALWPHSALREELGRAMADWQARYPHLRFHHPDDVHMTLRFLGRVPVPMAETLVREARSGPETWPFERGGAHFMGRERLYLALRYECSPEIAACATRLRARAACQGALPERTFRGFTPHLSLATVDRSSAAALREASNFLLQERPVHLESLVLRDVALGQRRAEPTDGRVYERLT